MQHIPRKRFGQNFLQNQQIIDAIIRAIHLQPCDNVVEIGPGLGALTIPLLRQLPKLTAIEIDRDLQEQLANMPESIGKLQLIKEDALKVDFSQLGEQQRILGNLPYNISTPLLIHLLGFLPYIEDMHFMLQKEVVQRLTAEPGSKDYGRLAVMFQYYCETEALLDVPPEAFFPQPKVDSSIIRLTPHEKPIYPEVPFAELEALVAKAFSMRRKTLANNLKPWLTAGDLEQLGIDPKRRPEQISIREYIEIAKFVAK